jgi:hypothetical protein
MWRHVLPMCRFSFLQMICKIAWSKGDNSSELSNFDAIVKIKENADCRQKEKEMKKGTSAIHGATFFLLKGAWRHAIYFS